MGVNVIVGIGVDVKVGTSVFVGKGVNVEVGIRVSVGTGVAVGVSEEILVGVGDARLSDSKAPISQWLPCGRVTPFCEVLLTGTAAQAISSPALIAGEPANRA